MEILAVKLEGRIYINTTPHPITFQDSQGGVVTVPSCGHLVNARPIEEPAGGRDGVQFVRTRFEADEASVRILNEIERQYPGAFIIGSIIAAQAFPGRVLAMVPVPGFERVPPAEKRMRVDKFTVF